MAFSFNPSYELLWHVSRSGRNRDQEVAPTGDSVRQESISDSMIVDCVR